MNHQLDELQWKSPEWIQAFGLRTDNVLDYFAESPFFNKTSNNQVIKMQRQFSQLPLQADSLGGQGSQDSKQDQQQEQSAHGAHNHTGGIITSMASQRLEQNEFAHLDPVRKDILSRYPVHAMLERELMKMKGVEYVLGYIREPDFWVIKKQKRLGPESTQVLQDYYIIGANVYQSPTIFKIVQSRLMSTTFHLSHTLKRLQTLTEFQPSQGVQFIRQHNLAGSASSGTAPTGTSSTTNSVPATAATNTNIISSTVPTGQTSGTLGTLGTSHADQNGANGQSNVITEDMMQKLMFISIKSQPEFI